MTQQKQTQDGSKAEKLISDIRVYNDFKDFPHTKWTPYRDTIKCPPSSYNDVRGLDNNE